MTTEQRVERIEKQLNRYRRLLTLTIGGVAAYVATWILGPQMLLAQPATATSKEIRSLSFVLVDESDKIRAVLGFEESGSVSLKFRDVNGKIRLGISAGEEGSGLAILDESGKLRVDLAVNKDEPRFAFSDGSSKPRFVIFESSDGSLMLNMFDESETTRIALGLDKDGPVLSLYGKDTPSTVGLGVDKDDLPLIVTVDKDGKVWSTFDE